MIHEEERPAYKEERVKDEGGEKAHKMSAWWAGLL